MHFPNKPWQRCDTGSKFWKLTSVSSEHINSWRFHLFFFGLFFFLGCFGTASTSGTAAAVN
jgi:hypothetical protein